MSEKSIDFEATFAELRVYDENLEPEAISQILGLTPSSSRSSIYEASHDSHRPRLPTSWLLSTRGRSLACDLSEHLRVLIQEIEGKYANLQELYRRHVQACYIYVFFQSKDIGYSPLIPVDTLSKISRLGLELAFSVHFFGNDGVWKLRLHPASGSRLVAGPSPFLPTLSVAQPPRRCCWRTPLNRDYGSADRAYATLHVESSCLSTAEISNQLRLQPTAERGYGELLCDDSGYAFVCDTALWQLSSESFVDSLDLRHHLYWLQGKLRHAAAVLSRLRSTQKIKSVRIRCYWWSTEGHGGPILSSHAMSFFARAEIPCDFRFYFSTNGLNDFRIF